MRPIAVAARPIRPPLRWFAFVLVAKSWPSRAMMLQILLRHVLAIGVDSRAGFEEPVLQGPLAVIASTREPPYYHL
eukprot:2330-Heterococcus_DN1.PRE.2